MQANTIESDTVVDPFEETQRRQKEERLVALAGLTPRERSITLETFIPATASQKKAVEVVREISMTGRGNAFLYGERGVGKTHLGLGLINSQIGKAHVRFLPTARYLMEVIREQHSVTHLDQIERLVQCKVIVLDDFGTQKITEWSLPFMDVLFDEWWRHEKQGLIVTSNFSLKEISTTISDRIASRIAGMCKVIEMKGEDGRIQ